MNTQTLRTFCLSLPQVTEDIKWEDHLCFLIAKKMFAVGKLEETRGHVVSFKCSPERFAELVEMDGIIPAPYMARNHWVALERWDALRDAELRDALRESYRLVVERLPKTVQRALSDDKPGTAVTAKRRKPAPSKRTAKSKRKAG